MLFNPSLGGYGGICPKLNIIVQLEFELAYYNSTVQHFNHYTTRTLLANRCASGLNRGLSSDILIPLFVSSTLNGVPHISCLVPKILILEARKYSEAEIIAIVESFILALCQWFSEYADYIHCSRVTLLYRFSSMWVHVCKYLCTCGGIHVYGCELTTSMYMHMCPYRTKTYLHGVKCR